MMNMIWTYYKNKPCPIDLRFSYNPVKLPFRHHQDTVIKITSFYRLPKWLVYQEKKLHDQFYSINRINNETMNILHGKLNIKIKKYEGFFEKNLIFRT